MSYDAKLSRILKFVPSAVDAVFEEHSEAAISWNKESAVQAIIAKLKLDLPDLNSESEAYSAVESALAALLMSGKIRCKAFGYSSLGNEDVNSLFQRYAAPIQAAPMTVQEEYADIVADFHGLSSLDLMEKKNKTPGYLERFNRAVEVGAI
jgi:hypothetical protein